jgi:hypothetical protein
VTGGEGEDTFYTGHWTEGNEATVIADFTDGEDLLVYGYDASQPEPTMSMTAEANSSGGTDAVIMADGNIVMRLVNAGNTSDVSTDIALLPDS